MYAHNDSSSLMPPSLYEEEILSILILFSLSSSLKVVGNEKFGGSGMRQTVPICLGPRQSRFVSLSILPSFLILSISVSAPVKQNE
jgi:hypothetical protein